MSYELSNIINSIICADCFDVLKHLPDKSVDLILTDPPYGIGEDGSASLGRTRNCSIYYTEPHKYATGWDIKPSPEFFSEIKRISKNQIVWGGNYFAADLGSSPCWLYWDKQTTGDFSDGEIAFTSFKSAVRSFSFLWSGFKMQAGCREERFHPTQKPVPLFKWCLANYSKPGDLVLDPMCGSGTTALACHALGRRYICIDKETEYVTAARNRLLQVQAQGDLFGGENSALLEENETSIQQTLYAAGGVPPLAGGTC